MAAANYLPAAKRAPGSAGLSLSGGGFRAATCPAWPTTRPSCRLRCQAAAGYSDILDLKVRFVLLSEQDSLFP